MAGLHQHPRTGSWVVSWREEGHAHTKDHASRESALEWMEAQGLPYKPRRRGRAARSRQEVIAHLADNFEVDASGCWLWTGPLTNAGYGRFTWQPLGTVIRGAHRAVLHAIGQPVPTDLVVDHLCRNRSCINPDHLDVVVQRENVMRSPIALGALNAAKTHCSNGHEYTEENTHIWRDTSRSTTVRFCKTCQRKYARGYQRRKRAAEAKREPVTAADLIAQGRAAVPDSFARSLERAKAEEVRELGARSFETFAAVIG